MSITVMNNNGPEVIEGPYKLCCKCLDVKSLKDFIKHKSYKTGYSSVCRACRLATKRKWRHSNYIRTLINSGDYRKELTLQWAFEQWDRQLGRCYWTGEPMIIGDPIRKPSLDRLRPGEPYTPDNTVWCHYRMNVARLNSPVLEFEKYLGELGVYGRTSTRIYTTRSYDRHLIGSSSETV